MKIGVFIKSSPASGGLEVQNQLLVNGLRSEGHEVEVVETAHPFGSSVGFATVPDVVISQSAAGTRYLLGRGSKPPVVVIQHGTLGGSLKTCWLMTPPSKRFFLALRLIPYAAKAYILDQLRLRRAAAIIAVSEQVRQALMREYFLPSEKVHLVYNGIELERFGMRYALRVMREELGISESDKVLLYIGRVEKEKGLEVFLNAIFRMPHTASRIALLVVGDGTYLQKLKSLAEQLGIADRVHFVGRVSYTETPKYYQAADIFVLPSTAWEGLPMTIIEAMATGLPVVASRIGGIPESVLDGETGSLVAPGNVEELSAALTNLLSEDELRSRMGLRGREVAIAKFSQKAMVVGTLGVMRSALSVKRKVGSGKDEF